MPEIGAFLESKSKKGDFKNYYRTISKCKPSEDPGKKEELPGRSGGSCGGDLLHPPL